MKTTKAFIKWDVKRDVVHLIQKLLDGKNKLE